MDGGLSALIYLKGFCNPPDLKKKQNKTIKNKLQISAAPQNGTVYHSKVNVQVLAKVWNYFRKRWLLSPKLI